jgi:molybdopterin synthase catalytic subunit
VVNGDVAGPNLSTTAVVRRCEVTTEPLDIGAYEAAVAGPDRGAVVSFAGVVRDHDGARAVVRLVYEAHPSAQRVLEQIAAEVAAEVAAGVATDSGVRAVALGHRVGPLEIGDAALVVAVAAAHRREAFAGCARLVDEVKNRLPVWKHQLFADGTDEWVNCA